MYWLIIRSEAIGMHAIRFILLTSFVQETRGDKCIVVKDTIKRIIWLLASWIIKAIIMIIIKLGL